MDEEVDNEFLKAFKMANFEYVDESEAAAEEEAQQAAAEAKASVNNPERTSFWEELLKDKYEVHKVEELNSLGKGKRNRKQMVSVEDDDLAGLEDVSSDGEDDNYEAELSDSEPNSAGAPSGRRPRKRARAESMEPLPLMESEGRSLRVLGFNQSQRAAFVQILMRFGVGEFDWAEFVPRLKQKTYEEIRDYGRLFLAHLAEEINDSPTFSDGVPKEGLRVQDVLVRIAVLLMIRDKVKSASERSDEPLFADDIMLRYPALKGGRIWKREHDLTLLRAVLKHGYGRWQAILDDKDLQFQELVSQELNLPVINLAGIIGNNPNQSGSPMMNVEPTGDTPKDAVGENGPTSESPSGGADAATLLYQYREAQRRQVEFIKKRVLVLEKGLNAECQKDYFGGGKSNGVCSEEPEKANKAADTKTTIPPDVDGLIDKLPRVEVLAPGEVSSASYDNDPRRQQLAQHYNEVCKVLTENEKESVRAFLANEADPSLGKRLHQLESICEKVNHIIQKSNQPSNSNPSSKAETIAEGQAMQIDAQTESKAKTEETDGKPEKEDGKSGVVVLDD